MEGPAARITQAARYCLLQRHAAARNLDPRTFPSASPRQPVASGLAVGVPGAHSPRAGTAIPDAGKPAGSGTRPGCGRACPGLPERHYPPRASAITARSPSVALNLMQTEVPSGLAASFGWRGRTRWQDRRPQPTEAIQAAARIPPGPRGGARQRPSRADRAAPSDLGSRALLQARATLTGGERDRDDHRLCRRSMTRSGCRTVRVPAARTGALGTDSKRQRPHQVDMVATPRMVAKSLPMHCRAPRPKGT